MSEDSMVALIQQALHDQGIQDEVTAAGEFNPRGHIGGLFAGGLVGGEVGGMAGPAASLKVSALPRAPSRGCTPRTRHPASLRTC